MSEQGGVDLEAAQQIQTTEKSSSFRERAESRVVEKGEARLQLIEGKLRGLVVRILGATEIASVAKEDLTTRAQEIKDRIFGRAEEIKNTTRSKFESAYGAYTEKRFQVENNARNKISELKGKAVSFGEKAKGSFNSGLDNFAIRAFNVAGNVDSAVYNLRNEPKAKVNELASGANEWIKQVANRAIDRLTNFRDGRDKSAEDHKNIANQIRQMKPAGV